MKNQPHITILMATFNGAAHIDAQLHSLAAQDHSDWALWVSDDGSRDGTCDKIRAFAAAHPDHDIRLMDGPHNGPAANFLHLLCHPDLPAGPVALCDQDDIWKPHKLRAALNALNGMNTPAVYSAQSRHITADGTPIKNSRVHLGLPDFGNALVQNRVAGHCATLNAAALSLVRRAGRVDVEFHDWWIYMLVQGAGGSVIVTDDVVLDYRQHRGNVLGGNRARFAGLKRIVAVIGPRFRAWQMRNAAALEDNSDMLTPAALQTLENWKTAPAVGLARARHLHRIGLVRDTKLATLLLMIAASLGRV